MGSALPSSGSGTSSGVASTPSTFRQPASAVWVWSMISDSSAMGMSSRLIRNVNATSTPTPRPQPGPQVTPTAMAPAMAKAPKMSPRGNIAAK